MADLMISDQKLSLDQQPALVYLAQFASVHSRRNLKRCLEDMVELLVPATRDITGIHWHQLRSQHTQFIRARLIEQGGSVSTINQKLSALRGVLKSCWRLELMDAETYQRAVDFENVNAETLPAGRDLSFGEIQALCSVCNQDLTAAGARDAAIIGVFYMGGLRRSELVNIQFDQFDPDKGQLKIIKGKGRKDRTVYITGGVAMAMQDWLILRGDAPGPLFTHVTQKGDIRIKSLTEQAVYKMLKKRADEAGVDDFSPHDFRRTFVGDMLDRGVDIATVANITGHSSVETTRRYDRRGEGVKQEAAEKLHYPYQRIMRDKR